MHWPLVAVEPLPLPAMSQKCFGAYHPRKKRRKNRRLLFDRRKSHILQMGQISFEGFTSSISNDQEGFVGFSNGDILNSIIEFQEMDTFLHEEYLMPYCQPGMAPITCISLSVTGCGPQYSAQLQPVTCLPIRVLSLFDGIATGLHILRDKLNMHVEVYFSSEIDADAIKVQRHNFFGELISLGDVRKIDETFLHSLGRIDLLIGGSPCNEISMVNPQRKGINDVNSSGNLFFKYLEVRDVLRRLAGCRGHPFFWLFENTSNMEKQTKTAMSCALGSNPIMKCSSKYLPVKRRRLFWGNIPHMHESVEQVNSTPMRLQDILKPFRYPIVDILPTLTTSSHSQRSGFDGALPVLENGTPVGLSVVEREELFGFPPHYTDTGDLNNFRRAKLLGRCWSVPVVTELLRPLSEIFKQK